MHPRSSLKQLPSAEQQGTMVSEYQNRMVAEFGANRTKAHDWLAQATSASRMLTTRPVWHAGRGTGLIDRGWPKPGAALGLSLPLRGCRLTGRSWPK